MRKILAEGLFYDMKTFSDLIFLDMWSGITLKSEAFCGIII